MSHIFLLTVIGDREPQGLPKGMRVKDVGLRRELSRTRKRMPHCNVMRTVAMPQPERVQTSDRWRITRRIRKGSAAGGTDRHRASGPTGDGAADGKPQTEYESVS